MANDILTSKNAPGVTAKLIAAHLVEKAMFCKSISKEDDAVWDEKSKAASPGDTIYVKVPPIMEVVEDNLDITSNIKDIKDQKAPLTLDKTFTVPFEMTSLETAYDKPIKYWNDEYVEPAVTAIAAHMDKWALEKAARYTSNLVGTAGTQPGAIRTFLQARQKMVEHLAPTDNKNFCLITPATNTETVDVRKGLFHKSDLIAEQYEMGYIGTGEGFNYMEGNLLPTFTNGADIVVSVEADVVTIVNGMSTLGIDGVTSGATITKGTVFTIAGVYDVHPVTKQAYTYLKQFTVLADVTEVSGNTVTLSISPAIYYTTTDPRQNVSTAPLDEGVITTFGSASTAYAQNLAFHKNAFRLATRKLYLPKNEEFSAEYTQDGISVSAIRFFDGHTRKNIMRFDVLAGLAAVRPEWACRITG